MRCERFLAMLTPKDRAECDSRFASGFRIANLVADIDRLFCFYTAFANDLAELRCFAKNRSAAIEAIDQRRVFRSENPLYVFTRVRAHDGQLNSCRGELAQSFVNPSEQ